MVELREQQVLALQMIANFVLPASPSERHADRADQRLPHHRSFEQGDAARRADRFQDIWYHRFVATAEEQD